MIPLVANDFPRVSAEFLKFGLNLPQVWSFRGTGLGMYTVSTLWSWPLDFWYGLGATLGLSFELLERIAGIAPIFAIGAWGMAKLLDHFKIGSPGKWIGVLLYLANTYLLLLVDGGQLSIALAYAFLPLAFLSIIYALGFGYQKKILAGLAVSALAVFDIRFVLALGLLVLFHSFFTKQKLSSLAHAGIIVGLIFLGLNAYWIFPIIFAQGPTLPVNYTRVSQADFLGFTEFKHAVMLLQPHWPKNVFGAIPPASKEFILIPILAFAAIFLHRRKTVFLWTAMAILSVFLVKGSNPPLASIYQWLYANVPGFYVFRDSTKFFVLTAMSYSVLVALTVNVTTKRLSGLKTPILIGVIAYLIFLARPVIFGEMTGILSRPVYQEEYQALTKEVEKDKEFGRMVWLPKRPPLGMATELHSQIDGLSLIELRPFAIGVVGKYETMNFLRESSFVDQLLNISGVKYISYPYPDARREELDEEDTSYYHAFSSQLGALPWIDRKVSDYPVNTFVTRKNQDRFFVTDNTYCIVGSDKIYQSLPSGFELAKNATIFMEEYPGIASTVPANTCKYVLHDKTMIDMAASFVSPEKFISVARELDFSPNGTGWWKRDATDLIWWRDFLQQKYGLDNLDFDYGQGWGVAEGNLSLKVSSSNFQKNNVLLARVMLSARAGEIVFSQGEEEVGRINTHNSSPPIVTQKLTGYGEIPDRTLEYAGAEFFWYEVGELKDSEPINISTSGDINVVNTLISLDKEEWRMAKEQSSKVKIVELNSLQNTTSPQVEYIRVSPTKYKVTVSGLSGPTTLVFSETYNPLWTMGEASVFKVYSMFNGFKVEKDGEYEVVFEAQRYVELGLIFSAVTILAVVLGYNLANGRIKKNPRH